MTIGEKIYKFRNSLHLTQKQFADKAGVAQSSINFWENGKRQPKIEQLQKISTAFNVPIDALIDDDVIDLRNSVIELFGELKEVNTDPLSIYLECEDFTKEELAELKEFAKFLKSKRCNIPEPSELRKIINDDTKNTKNNN